MLELNLQFFCGNGSDGPSLSGSSGAPVNIVNETDVWSYRHNPNNEAFVDQINSATQDISNAFPSMMDTVSAVNATEFGGSDKQHTLGVYGSGRVGINTNYTDPEKMNRVYDDSVESGHHPSRGNKTGVEAVTYHEMGHALTDNLVKKAGAKDLDGAAKIIVDNAYKNTQGKGGTKAWAGNISGYAQSNYAECVAEAVADYFCNGKNSKRESKAIYNEMMRISKL